MKATGVLTGVGVGSGTCTGGVVTTGEDGSLGLQPASRARDIAAAQVAALEKRKRVMHNSGQKDGRHHCILALPLCYNCNRLQQAKSCLRRFNGIASRYLLSYCGWQRVLDDGELRTPELLLTAIIRFAIEREKKPN